jgi:hypothetical protein
MIFASAGSVLPLGSFADTSFISSTFSGTKADDLEFNSPDGSTKYIIAANSTFSNNKNYGSYGAGFGIGLANVQGILLIVLTGPVAS